jgi:hypothetical protein
MKWLQLGTRGMLKIKIIMLEFSMTTFTKTFTGSYFRLWNKSKTFWFVANHATVLPRIQLSEYYSNSSAKSH